MKSKCDKCGRPATIYLTEIVGGQKIEKNFCEECASSEGITVKANIPISQLLEEFVLHGGSPQQAATLKCNLCGMTFDEFRAKGQLGCPNDYEAFAAALDPLIGRAQDGATQHVGKVPSRGGGDLKHQATLLRLRAELKSAIFQEKYEWAADLRDQIKHEESQP